jgi:hypothetical protein
VRARPADAPLEKATARMPDYDQSKAIDWMTDWRRVEPMAQRDYVRAELARVAAAGGRVLTQVLTLPLEIQQIVAMKVLHEDDPLPGHRWYVRLMAGAAPHERDPQGRPLPREKRGHVEVVKVGTKGGQLRDTSRLPGAVTARFNSVATQADAARGVDIYVCREIGRDPVELSLHDAVVVLGKYGCGVPLKRFWNRTADGGGWDAWIIEEVPPAEAEDLLLEKRAKERDAAKAARKPSAA